MNGKFLWFYILLKLLINNSYCFSYINNNVLEIVNKIKLEKTQYLNRFLFYGTSGNGKTYSAQQTALQTDSILITIDCPLLINNTQGSGAQNINYAFELAIEQNKKESKKIVILIDRIDCLAFAKDENNLCIEAICINLDKIEHNANYLVIITAINLNLIDHDLLNRFGNNIIEFANPNENNRLEIIERLNENLALKLKANLIKQLAKMTSKMNIRSINNILYSLKLLPNYENLDLIRYFNSSINSYKQKINIKNLNSNWPNKINLNLQIFNLILNIIPNLASSAIILGHIYKFFKNSIDRDKPVFIKKW